MKFFYSAATLILTSRPGDGIEMKVLRKGYPLNVEMRPALNRPPLNHIRVALICSIFATLVPFAAAHMRTFGSSLMMTQERQDVRSALIGTWKAKSEHRIIFTFAKDGTGNLISDDDTEHFTYSIRENKLVVKQDQETV